MALMRGPHDHLGQPARSEQALPSYAGHKFRMQTNQTIGTHRRAILPSNLENATLPCNQLCQGMFRMISWCEDSPHLSLIYSKTSRTTVSPLNFVISTVEYLSHMLRHSSFSAIRASIQECDLKDEMVVGEHVVAVGNGGAGFVPTCRP